MICAECGRAITWETQKGHHYGRCTKHKTNCSQRMYVREEKVHNQVLQTLDKFKIENSKILEWVKKALKEVNEGETDYHENIMLELENKRKTVEKKLNQLYEDRLDLIISKEFYQSKQAELEKELDILADTIDRHIKANINYQKLGVNLFELSQKG